MKKILFSFLTVLVALPAFAVEFTSGEFKANVYGDVYVDGFYTYQDDTNGNTKHSFTSQSLVGSSRLGVTLSYGDISATFEAGVSDPVRKYFLTYNIKGQEDHFLVLGRDTTIAAYSFGAVTHDFGSLNSYGTLADNRRLQLRYGIKGFEMAVILPYIEYSSADDTGYGLTATEKVKDGEDNKTKDVTSVEAFKVLPRLELAYTYATDALELKVFGAYGAYLYEDNLGDADDLVLHSYNIGFGGQANFGASFLQFTGWYGNNLELMDALDSYKRSMGVLEQKGKKRTITVDKENIQSAGVALGIGHTFAEKYTPSLGVGYTLNFGDGYDEIDDRLGVYANVAIKINDWFSITPEIAYYDDMNDSAGKKESYEVVAGAVAAVSF